jgi:Protein of unknown function (DUF2877)
VIADLDVVDAGEAWFERPARIGVVRACFARAVYVGFGADLLAVGDDALPAGPLHLRLRRFPPLTVGQRFDAAIDPDRCWRPAAVDPRGLVRHRDIVRATLGRISSPFDGDLTERVEAVLHAGGIVDLARLIGGRGQGLTPAGDDVLAGIMVADALGPDRFPTQRSAAATAAPTTDVARAFLRWAARGRSIEPVHVLLGAVATGDADAAGRALRALLAVGAMSGSDLAFGLRLGLGQPDRSTLATSTPGPRASVFDT